MAQVLVELLNKISEDENVLAKTVQQVGVDDLSQLGLNFFLSDDVKKNTAIEKKQNIA